MLGSDFNPYDGSIEGQRKRACRRSG